MSETEAVSGGAARSCSRCGAPLSLGRFCLNCGAPVDAPAEGRDPASTPAGRSRLRRTTRWVARRRTPIVVVPLIAALTIAGGVGAQMLTADIPPDATPEIACWDGSLVESAEECPLPTGREGMQWVFPTFKPDDGGCRNVLLERPENERPGMWECAHEVEGRRVTVTYMELAAVETALRFFERQFDGRPREEVSTAEGRLARYVWRRPVDGGSELVAMYVDHPYAVSIRAGGGSLLTLALRTVEFRHPDRISVVEAPD